MINILNVDLFVFKKMYLFVRTNTINSMDAILCIKKYIILLWEEYEFFFINIKGINDIILISNPIHIFIQFLDLITNRVLNKVIEKNNIFLEVFIKKKKDLLLYLGYEPKSLFSLSFYILVYVAYKVLIFKDLV